MADLKTCVFAGIDAMPASSTGGSGQLCYCSDMMVASGHHVVQCQLLISESLSLCRPVTSMGIRLPGVRSGQRLVSKKD